MGHGVHYRQRVGASSAGSAASAYAGGAGQSQTYQTSPGFSAIPTANAASLVDERSEKILADINETVSLPSSLRILVPIAIATLVASVFVDPSMPFIMAALWLGPLIYAANFDRKARTYALLFELDPAAESRFRAMNDTLAQFARAHQLWRVAANAYTGDWKRNAGAQTLVDRKVSSVRQVAPPFISTNVKPWCINAGDQHLYFLPDRLYVFQRGRYGAVEYDTLNVDFSLDTFIESGFVPPDAPVVSTTYQYVNKNGTPDRRFSNNRQIPVVQYGRVMISSPDGLNIHLQVSSPTAAQTLTGIGRRAATTSRQQPPHGFTSQGTGQRTQTRAPSTPRCYVVLGLKLGCSKDEASQTFRALAKRYHPDTLGALSPSLAAIAEERMKEINIAYGEIRQLNGW